ncbi:hypothetical protein HYH03_010207 [Edaphochlamys debaryana]|uniref:C2H2-type domain-containing protein n=1 Tax=Edaphochlamys debaryana TaxID=47281 RepID=A0A835XWC3_9CHLO|nr:hypothetical protein HYH03_010207 [Edaphochlamys debaryana]|eukprot:KAG2491418.1 hypothetical protein HYH03_010207 [Edaphochlamys debaryana]
MATNLCAECGTRLPRSEYKTHMRDVHGVAVMNDSDDETTKAQATQPAANGDGEVRAHPVDAGDGEARPPRAPRRVRRNPGGADGAPGGDFACTECDRTFASQQGLRRHLQAKHPDSPATAAAVAATNSEAPAPGRRGGRGGRAEGADGADAANGDGAAKPSRPPRQRQPRRPRGAAAVPADPEQAAAMAAAAAANALGSGGGAPRPEKLVTLFRCTKCEQGFKSKNRARAHVTEAHADDVPAEAPAATEAEAAPEPADGLLELVEVPSRRPNRPRRGPRKEGAGGEVGEDGEAKPPPVRRGGRPPPKAKGDGAAAPAGEGKKGDDLAALGIVS